MQRIAFLIRVWPEKLDEYRMLHNPIWPELAAELKASGINNYTLYLECDNWKKCCSYLADSELIFSI